MELFALILYGGVNLVMVVYYLLGRARFYQFPFWAGTFAMGWVFPQAIGGYLNYRVFPGNAYLDGMLFATLCMVALWIGYEVAARRISNRRSWLEAPFDATRLYWAAVVLCSLGFFSQWKLWSLPEELLAVSQPSGVVVKYIFFGNVFKFGLIALCLLYLSQPRVLAPKILVFLIPSLLLIFAAVVLRGRRAAMMDLLAYISLGLWFVRRIAVPRWVMVVGLSTGLVLINGIGTYRTIMKNKEIPLAERLSQAAAADYLEAYKRRMHESGAEFENYIYRRQVHVEEGMYDFGGSHWDKLVFNYVPAQLVGRELKESLMLQDPMAKNPQTLAKEKYGHVQATGSTITGYCDAFASFGWFGFAKFLLVGCIMGVLYRHAMQGAFLGQFLYIYALTKAIQTVSHGTNDILIRVWVYFFALGFPFLLWAKGKSSYLKLEINERRGI